jgi:hypothetical protein
MEPSSPVAMEQGSEDSKYLTMVANRLYRILCSGQLNGALSIVLSKESNALYISDQKNHRVQRWYLNESEGVTIAGSPACMPGKNASTLNIVNNIALNANETRLFISDRNNSRIQMFELI